MMVHHLTLALESWRQVDKKVKVIFIYIVNLRVS